MIDNITFPAQQHDSGAEKVLSRIVSDALTIARGRDIADTSARIRIGKYEFREQDYQQILIWAQEAGLERSSFSRCLEEHQVRCLIVPSSTKKESSSL